jgi:hypothetical protein
LREQYDRMILGPGKDVAQTERSAAPYAVS